MSTLCRLMNSSIWLDTIALEWFIIHIKGSQVRLEMSQCDKDAAARGNCMREKKNIRMGCFMKYGHNWPTD